MDKRDKQIFAYRASLIAGIFSLIVGVIMLLNYWQLKTTDPLESVALKNLVERLKEDNANEDLKVEIRNLDLMARNAFFTNQWQIRSGAYLLIGGLIIMVISLRVYFTLDKSVSLPESSVTKLDLELLITRKGILYTLAIIFGAALVASFLSVDHLTDAYALTENQLQTERDEIPTVEISSEDESQEISIRPSEETDTESPPLTEEVAETVSMPLKEPEAEADNIEKVTVKPSFPGHEEIIRNFPSFRGPYGMGIAYQKNIPTKWAGASGENIKWKIPLDLPGYNSPVIWGNKVFLTGANENNQKVYCYDLETGKLNWQYKVPAIQRGEGKFLKPSEDTGYAAPSLVCDGTQVIAIFATGDIVSVDMNGQQIWARNIGVPENHYGHSSSLLTWKNKVLIQFDTSEKGRVLALDKNTGQIVWDTNRASKISWASPILINRDNQLELILSSSPSVGGYDIETGKELWTLSCLSGEVGPSPAFYQGVVYVSNEYASLVAIRLRPTPEILWESNEYLPEVSSPVVVKGLLFLGTSYGVIACFDAANGEFLWEYECNDGIYSSPMVVEDKVYFLDLGGVMHIFNIDREMKLVAEPELGESTFSTPAFASGKIIIRGFDHLYCIGK